MRVCLGGTFDPFHVGHERLLERALEAAGPDGEVFIGLVSDAFSATKRSRQVAPFASRKQALEAWFDKHGANERVRIRPLEEPFGPSATGDYDVLVASAETAGTGAAVNAKRLENGLAPLRVEVVPLVLAQDLLPVSATRVAAGRIDRTGRRLVPLRIAVGSANPVKVDAVRDAFEAFLPGVAVTATGHAVPSGVADQPWDGATLEGARNRARAAHEADPDADYAVGVEAGLFTAPDADPLDVQHCVIRDQRGHETHGHGAGFHYPKAVIEAVRAGRTIGDVLGDLADEPDIGRTQGAVGWLTRGRLDRRRLTRQAVEAALVPRVRPDLYAE